MRRKGGRSVTSQSEMAASASATATPRPTAAAPSRAHEGTRGESESAAPEQFPSVAIPTMNIFARFQRRRDDFDADWLMLEEDAGAAGSGSPLSASVAEKLRRHQRLLSSTRAAAGARGAAPTGALSLSKNSADFDDAAAAVDAVKTGTSVRAARAPPQPTPSPPSSRASAGSHRHSSDDDERAPAKNAARGKASPAAAPADAVSPSPRPARTEGQPKASEGAEEGEEEEGMRGDYLTFLPKHSAVDGVLGAGHSGPAALQAVVAVPAQRSARASSKADNHKDSNSTAAVNAAPPMMVVPLWSQERVRRFGGYYRDSRLVALHQEVMDLVDFLRPTVAEVAVRRLVELQVVRLAQRLWPGSRVIVYGSMYTHLLLPLSDVDMTIVDLPANVGAEEALTLLANEVSKEGLCQAAYPQLILKTKVPLIKFQHKGSLVDIDISVNATDGRANSDIVIHLLNCYPEARPLIIVIKYFLQQRDMHEPYHGGLGSYATTLLVISFLQNHPMYTTRPHERPVTGLGKLLVDFFRYCGQCWNYHRCGVSLTGGGHYFQRTESAMFAPTSSPTSPRGPMGPPQAMIEDPLNAANNAASSLRNYHVISSVFSHAYLSLTAPFPTVFEAAAASAGAPPEKLAEVLASFSPDALVLSHRPTLLSRVMHVDAETVNRRQSVEASYAELCAANPVEMDEARAYRQDEDAPMLDGTHVLRVLPDSSAAARTGTATAAAATTSPLTRGEARGVASLAASQFREAMKIAAAEKRKRARADSSASSSSGSDADSSSSSNSSGSSNASSVRVDVSRPTDRRRRMTRHSPQ